MTTLTKMPTKTILKPEMIPSVAIDFMNNTHFEEIALVQDIGDRITQYQESKSHTGKEAPSKIEKEITQLIHTWLDHTEAHFARENELMIEHHFPAYDIHANEHKAAFERMSSVVKKWDTHKEIGQLDNYIFNLWPTWFSQHVNSMDMMTAQHAVMNGYSPE